MNGQILSKGPEYHKQEVINAVNEAFDWLYVNGLIVGHSDSGQRGHGVFMISRKGIELAEKAEPLRLLRAEHLLALPLHARIETKARIRFAIGEYEAAVLMALRELEIRVRAAGPFGPDDRGPDLMRKAFNPDKPGLLADPELQKGEQSAVADLYAGAMGAFKNPPSHRTVDYADPIIAAEQLLLADLLHRMLDVFEDAKAKRQAGSVAASSPT